MKLDRSRNGFTLLELLIVIGIIVLLLSILLPVFSNVRGQAHAVVCQNNQRTLWQGILAFASDNDGHVVGNQWDTAETIPTHRDWLRGGDNTATGWQGAPQAGTLWKYIRNPSVYLCPSREHYAGIGTGNNDDLSSNGHFDYAIFLSFAGAKLEHLPPTAVAKDSVTQAVVMTLPTPYIVEEQPNGVNNANREGGHATSDHMAHNHFGGSYYISPDGSCQFNIEPWGVPSNITAACYFGTSPRGRSVSLGLNNPVGQWGGWDGQ